MAFPTISVTTGFNNSNGTTHTVTMPASGIDNGDLILVSIGADHGSGSTAFTKPAAFTNILNFADTSDANVWTDVSALVADGTEESNTYDWTTTTNEKTAWQVMIIKGWDGTIGNIVSASNAAASSAFDPDPPAITISAADNLIITGGTHNGTANITAYPYADNNSAVDTTSGTGVTQFMCTDEIATANPNPGVFSTGGAVWGNAFTLGIPPSGAADTTAPTFSVNPAQDTVTDTSVTVDATAADETDATVDHYAVVVADGAAAPSGAQVAAGQDSTGSAAIASGNDTGVSNGAEGSIVMSGLTANTAYDAYYIVQDSVPNRSTPQLVNFTTLVAADRGLRIPVKNTSGDNYPDTTGITVIVYASVGGAENFETASGAITSGVLTINDDAVGALGAKVYVVGHKDGANDADDIGFQGEVTVVDLNTADNSV